jgi:hypothetical protein
MEGIYSYFALVWKLEQFCRNHSQIKRFGTDFPEQMGNMATLDDSWPFVFLSPVSKTLDRFVSTYTIDIYCWDRLEKGRSNIVTGLSDTDLILTDIWTWFINDEDLDIDVINNPTINPLNNGLLDYCVGNVLRINFQIDTYCSSDIPFDDTYNIITNLQEPLVTEGGDNLVWFKY